MPVRRCFRCSEIIKGRERRIICAECRIKEPKVGDKSKPKTTMTKFYMEDDAPVEDVPTEEVADTPETGGDDSEEE